MKRNEQIDSMLLASVLFLAERGLSSKQIAQATGLSIGQVFYRTGRFEVKLSDYRNGESEYAKRLIAQAPCVRSGITAHRGEKYRVAGVA